MSLLFAVGAALGWWAPATTRRWAPATPRRAAGIQSGVQAAGIQSGEWLRAEGQHSIHYEVVVGRAGAAAPVLLLNGFGVGAFHWHRLMKPLAEESGAQVFGMDYLGQGASWPVDCADGEAPSERGLRYAIDDWVVQTVEFIEQVVLPESPGAEGVRLVGNSLGGQIAALLAARRPELVLSFALLNAAPVWGSNLPGWDGLLPAPPLPRAVGRFLFDRMRDVGNIATMLKAVYAEPSAVGRELPRQIRAVTDESDGGHAAFASILWSPPAALPGSGRFDDLLRAAPHECLLLYGADDPWVTPAFGRAAHAALASRDGGARLRYVELSRCGHCPQHEAPRATAALLGRWLRGEEPLAGAAESFEEASGAVVHARQLSSEAELRLSPGERALTRVLS